MKISSKILLVTLCVAFCLPVVIYSTMNNDDSSADEQRQFQVVTQIDDLAYFVLIFADNEFYIDQFEFETGNNFKLTSRKNDYTGTWSGVDVFDFTYFTAKVEVTETSTSTTTTASTTGTNLADYQSQEVEKMSDYLVNIWGFAYTLPEPFQTLGSMIGGGAYLGADVFFLGFTSVTEEPTFGSIVPDTGQQCQKYTVQISGINTTFQSAADLDVGFTPPDDLTITNIRANEETQLTFDLDIGCSAQTGARTVTVTFDGQSITKNNAFTITASTFTTTTTTTTP